LACHSHVLPVTGYVPVTPHALPLPSCPAGDSFQDLHVFDPATMAWTDLSAATSGTPPSARGGHGFTSAGGKLYVHGGYINLGELPLQLP